jgi:hypothetical protein
VLDIVDQRIDVDVFESRAVSLVLSIHTPTARYASRSSCDHMRLYVMRFNTQEATVPLSVINPKS